MTRCKLGIEPNTSIIPTNATKEYLSQMEREVSVIAAFKQVEG